MLARSVAAAKQADQAKGAAFDRLQTATAAQRNHAQTNFTATVEMTASQLRVEQAAQTEAVAETKQKDTAAHMETLKQALVIAQELEKAAVVRLTELEAAALEQAKALKVAKAAAKTAIFATLTAGIASLSLIHI